MKLRKLLSADTGQCTDSILLLRNRARIRSLWIQKNQLETSETSLWEKLDTHHWLNSSLKLQKHCSKRQKKMQWKELQTTRNWHRANNSLNRDRKPMVSYL